MIERIPAGPSSFSKPLSNKPARTDLTDRELSRIIGGLIGSLTGVSESLDALRNAVRWWAENDEAWRLMGIQDKVLRDAGMGVSSPRENSK